MDGQSLGDGAVGTYSCSDEIGSYVAISLTGNDRILTLCEVEVYASDTDLDFPHTHSDPGDAVPAMY